MRARDTILELIRWGAPIPRAHNKIHSATLKVSLVQYMRALGDVACQRRLGNSKMKIRSKTCLPYKGGCLPPACAVFVPLACPCFLTRHRPCRRRRHRPCRLVVVCRCRRRRSSPSSPRRRLSCDDDADTRSWSLACRLGT